MKFNKIINEILFLKEAYPVYVNGGTFLLKESVSEPKLLSKRDYNKLLKHSIEFNMEDPTMGASRRRLLERGTWLLPNGRVIPLTGDDSHQKFMSRVLGIPDELEAFETALDYGLMRVNILPDEVIISGRKCSMQQKRNVKDFADFHDLDLNFTYLRREDGYN